MSPHPTILEFVTELDSIAKRLETLEYNDELASIAERVRKVMSALQQIDESDDDDDNPGVIVSRGTGYMPQP